MSRAVFLDRDGTLIEDPGFLSDPAGVRVLPGVPGALRRLRDAGFLLVVVTNQSGIGRGIFTDADYRAVDGAFREALGVPLDAVLFCPHTPDSKCSCRKPAPGMLRDAAARLDIDLARSFMVGDKPRDAAAGLAAGCRAILLGAGPAPDGARRAGDLAEAADLILAERPC